MDDISKFIAYYNYGIDSRKRQKIDAGTKSIVVVSTVVFSWLAGGVQWCIGNCPFFYYLYSKRLQMCCNDAFVVYLVHTPFKRCVHLYTVVKKLLPSSSMVRCHVLFFLVRRVSVYSG